MSQKSVSTLIILLMITVCTPLLAQDTEPQDTPPSEQPQPTFQLLRDSSSAMDELDIEEEEMEIWEPAIRGGTIELSFAFGFLDFNKVLWEHDQIIYKYTADATSWGDVKIKSESAFNPVLRLGYNLTDWISLEGVGGVAITEYNSTITNRWFRENKPGFPPVPDPALGEFDAENRSLLTIQASLNAVLKCSAPCIQRAAMSGAKGRGSAPSGGLKVSASILELRKEVARQSTRSPFSM